MLSEFRFHHIGIAVFDIDVTAELYVDAGYRKTDNVTDTLQNIKICFLEKEGMPMIELLAAVDDFSPVNRILKNVGVSPYHVCYTVSDIENAVKQLRKKRFLIISKPCEACALGNRRVCFLFHKDVGLIELLEETKR